MIKLYNVIPIQLILKMFNLQYSTLIIDKIKFGVEGYIIQKRVMCKYFIKFDRHEDIYSYVLYTNLRVKR